MLYRAAAFTLRLAREAMASHTEVKDATPYNIMFEGPNPVFLDVLSFGRLDPCESVWCPYAQFVRTSFTRFWLPSTSASTSTSFCSRIATESHPGG